MMQEVMTPASSTVTATKVLSSFTAPSVSPRAEVLSAAVVMTARPVFTAPSPTGAGVVGSVVPSEGQVQSSTTTGVPMQPVNREMTSTATVSTERYFFILFPPK